MATYNGLMDTVYGDMATTGSGVPTSIVFNDGTFSQNALQHLSKFGRTRAGRTIAKTLIALTGSAAGNASLNTSKRVVAATPFTMGNGGLVTLEDNDAINRNTTAADVTLLDAALAREFVPASYPVDLSGNGGGGKLNKVGA